jgi:ligand-binding sensor domain-containing protein
MSKGNGLRVYRDIEALREGVFDLYLNGLSVSNAFQDVKNGLWVVTQEQGIFYSANLELLIYDSRFGFSDDFVSAIAFKSKNELYAGCYNGDIFQVDLKGNQITCKLVNFYGYHNHDLLYQSEVNLLWSNSAYWKDNRWNFVSWRKRCRRKIQNQQTG